MEIIFKGKLTTLSKKIPENKINQGDFIFCDSRTTEARNFWGIYSSALKKVISLDGGGDVYIPKLDEIYLYDTYNSWTITKRIKPINLKVIIEEIN